jgi:hypothetical protein
MPPNKNNLMSQFFYKIFNKNKYKKNKYLAHIEKEKILFKNKYENYINLIQENLTKKKEISFLHSGHTGDIVNVLPILKELSVTHVCKLYIQLDLPTSTYYPDHPAGQFFMNKKIYRMLHPLLEKQSYINLVDVFIDQEIDVNFDLIRELPIRLAFDSMKYGSHISGTQPDLTESFLNVEDHNKLKNKIIILRSLRYQNQFINYDFLNKYDNVYFVGTIIEYEDLKKTIKNLKFYECIDFLELSEIIKSCKLFIGNSSLGFTIAEGLKVPRLLEASPWNPSQQVHGKNGYDFFFQSHFEKFFKLLYNK